MQVKIIECPRDAMQGLHEFIPTEKKVAYIQQLLSVGFDTLDFGSFVSPKAIPQLADTTKVLEQLDLGSTQTKLLAIVANVRGAKEAVTHPEIKYIGFPFSISETFQQRNTNSSIAQSVETVKAIQELCVKYNKELVIYISMGFGNPYGDVWNADIAIQWVHELEKLNIKIFSLSDTIGIATPESISYLFNNLIPSMPHLTFGAHLHTTPDAWFEKLDAAFNSGCTRFDGALKGYGGCPMAADTLTGNMPTEQMISYMNLKNIPININLSAFDKAMLMANELFN